MTAQGQDIPFGQAELARVPLTLTLSDERRSVGRDEVEELSKGTLAPLKRERTD